VTVVDWDGQEYQIVTEHEPHKRIGVGQRDDGRMVGMLACRADAHGQDGFQVSIPRVVTDDQPGLGAVAEVDAEDLTTWRGHPAN
jgi:hypothetical protein